MKGQIVTIQCYPEKNGPAVSMKEGYLLKNEGLEGDRHRGGVRQLCLLEEETLHWMKTSGLPGLCFRRFKANILTGGFDLGGQKVGGTLKIGGATIRISAIKGPCYRECALFRAQGNPCRLSQSAFFAQVIQSGPIREGDVIESFDSFDSAK